MTLRRVAKNLATMLDLVLLAAVSVLYYRFGAKHVLPPAAFASWVFMVAYWGTTMICAAYQRRLAWVLRLVFSTCCTAMVVWLAVRNKSAEDGWDRLGHGTALMFLMIPLLPSLLYILLFFLAWPFRSSTNES